MRPGLRTEQIATFGGEYGAVQLYWFWFKELGLGTENGRLNVLTSGMTDGITFSIWA